ncbi:hypothetical protein AMATHDRAFT_54308 [Amanita thiersii Skay4041]|uniref:Zn(2)-C6 fungal-type domain-containing protein n=1 Tax=Amanita thiersii Skay4041 TaxID=703135 RepID=A0A2A9NUL6_9AGAR|nr:hypothetical protein AMATHDRAFT_54308 [Amanita thiersii Skay4041]
MTDSIAYSATNQYLPPPAQYYPAQPIGHGHVHVVSQPIRSEQSQQRKRPKYTRSKTGCLTCRVKKIKCDETKPNCMRCTHGQRDCTWPEGVPARKKTAAKKDSPIDGRPSTASSSASSTPPTRDPTPPRRGTLDMGLLPMASRRSSDPYLQLHPMPAEPDPSRRTYLNNDRASVYSHHPNGSNVLTMIPEATSYPTQPRYDQHAYSSATASIQSSRHIMSTGFRPMSHHQAVNQWNPSPDSMDPYVSSFASLSERALVGHAPPNDSHTRY